MCCNEKLIGCAAGIHCCENGSRLPLELSVGGKTDVNIRKCGECMNYSEEIGLWGGTDSSSWMIWPRHTMRVAKTRIPTDQDA